jgi:hypothetical protein
MVWMRDQWWMPMSAAPAHRSVFTWKDFSRFVQVAPVERGWLVLWGHYREAGRLRDLAGQRTYVDLGGVRRRIADSVFELTKRPELVAEAITQFDRASIAERPRQPLPDPL